MKKFLIITACTLAALTLIFLCAGALSTSNAALTPRAEMTTAGPGVRTGIASAEAAKKATPTKTYFGSGLWDVPGELLPGTYKTTGGLGCYWARLSGFDGELTSVIANGLPEGPARVTVRKGDAGLELRGTCEWTRVR